MPFTAECFFCNHCFEVPDQALGGSGKCPKCKSFLTLVPKDEADPKIRPRSKPKLPQATTGSSGERAAAAVVEAPEVEVSTENDSSPANLGTPYAPAGSSAAKRLCRLWIVLGAVLVGIGLTSSAIAALTWLTLPLLAAAVLCAGFGWLLSFEFGGAEVGFGAGVSLASIVALALAFFSPSWLGPVYEASWNRSLVNRYELQAIPLAFPVGTIPPTKDPVDSTRFALQQDQVKIRVVASQVGPLDLKIKPKKGQSKEKFLQITVQIQHVGSQNRVEYVRWGSQDALEMWGLPVLLDETGKKLAWRDPDPALGVKGIKYRAALSPSQAVSDLLVFEAPAILTTLTLELPAAAWNGTGTFKFTIPMSVIRS